MVLDRKVKGEVLRRAQNVTRGEVAFVQTHQVQGWRLRVEGSELEVHGRKGSWSEGFIHRKSSEVGISRKEIQSGFRGNFNVGRSGLEVHSREIQSMGVEVHQLEVQVLD